VLFHELWKDTVPVRWWPAWSFAPVGPVGPVGLGGPVGRGWSRGSGWAVGSISQVVPVGPAVGPDGRSVPWVPSLALRPSRSAVVRRLVRSAQLAHWSAVGPSVPVARATAITFQSACVHFGVVAGRLCVSGSRWC